MVTLRPAERRDAAELAVIVDLSSHSFATWLWHEAAAGVADTAMEFGRNWMASDTQPGGWRDAVIAEVDGAAAGASIGYALDAALLSVVTDHDALAPLVALQKPLAGHWFIDSIGVYRRERRKGVARQLVQNEIRRAGRRPVSLITEDYNHAARAMYRTLGFSERARREAVPLHPGSRKHEWVLLTLEPPANGEKRLVADQMLQG